ncbi:MAG TPA: enoyl-CoA hydratase-related protein [Bacteroidota bacterium]|nr:enoyl-CoA hydratase-related protein [Bacteroidota bacterium]
MNFSRLSSSAEGRVCRITLACPSKENTLDDILVAELTQAIVAAAKDPAVKTVVLAGEGTAFCGGTDLEYLQKLSRFDFSQNLEDSKNLMKLFHLLYTMRKPVLAQVQGAAFASGCGLVCACDIVIASDDALFGFPEVSLGLIPAVVLTFLARKVGEGKAREMVMTGRTLRARDAHTCGLVNEVVPGDELEDRVRSVAEGLCRDGSGSSLGLIKEMFSRMDGLNLPDLLDYAANVGAAMRMSEDCRKGIAGFLNKEKVQW